MCHSDSVEDPVAQSVRWLTICVEEALIVLSKVGDLNTLRANPNTICSFVYHTFEVCSSWEQFPILFIWRVGGTCEWKGRFGLHRSNHQPQPPSQTSHPPSLPTPPATEFLLKAKNFHTTPGHITLEHRPWVKYGEHDTPQKVQPFTNMGYFVQKYTLHWCITILHITKQSLRVEQTAITFATHNDVRNVPALPSWPGIWLLNQFSLFHYFPHFSERWKHWLSMEYHFRICQVSPQLSCGDTWQIWMWFLWCDLYFCIEIISPMKKFTGHDDVIKRKHFMRYLSLCGEFTGHRWISLIKTTDAQLWCFLWKNDWINNRKDGNLRRHRAHCDVTVMNLLAPPLGTIEAWPVSSIPFSTSCGIFRLFTGYKDNMIHRMCIWFCCVLFCCALFNCGFIIDLRWYYNRVVSDFSRLAWFICMYFSRLLHWRWGRRMIVTLSVKYVK